MKRFRRILERVDLHLVDIAGQAPLVETIFAKSSQRAWATLPKAGAHWPILIALRCQFERCIQRAVFGKFSVQQNAGKTLLGSPRAFAADPPRRRRTRRRPACCAMGRADSPYGVTSCVESSHVQLLSDSRQRHHVIELRRRRLIHVQLPRTVDQHRIAPNPHSFQHRGQQRVLVLAVPITALQYVSRGVRLISSDAERNAYVTDVERHEVVQAPRLLFGSRSRLLSALPLLSHAVVDGHALALQFGIPLRDLLPIGEGR